MQTTESVMPQPPDLPDQPISSVEDLLALAIDCHKAWAYEEAEGHYRAILAAEPRHGDANHNLGILLAVQLLKPEAALPFFETALDANVGNTQYWLSYIDALIRAGQPALAQQVLPLARAQGLSAVQVNAASLRIAESMQPVAQAAPTIGLEAAPEASSEKSAPAAEKTPTGNAARWPGVAKARHSQRQPTAREVQELGQWVHTRNLEKARAAAQAMTERYPAHGLGWKVLAAVLKGLGDVDGAIRAGLQAIKRWPDDPEALSNLGNALREKNRLDEAEQHLKKAIAIKSDYAIFHNNLGMVYQGQGRRAEAEAAFRAALAIDPGYEDLYGNLLFTLNYHPDAPAEEIYEAYREYDQRFGMPLRAQWQAHANSRQPGRRLKIGYVSPDFRQHSCRHFMEPLLAHHDKDAIEVYAYAELAKEDALTARYKTYVEHWVPTRGMSDQALAERIRTDGIDILMDLAGHTGGNRLGVFARKPAPVSLSWMGYGYTSGLSAIDYYLTDEACAPKGSEHLFAETPWRLPTPGYAYRPGPAMGEVGELPAINNGHITFGTLTRAIRINHRTIRVWAQILNEVPNARLIIDSSSYKDEGTQEALAKQFAEHGIKRERLQIGFHSPPWDVLRSMDIGLDCFPHNSGTTLFESVYMGVPYITLAGRPSVGRLGGSILHGVNHPEWIAQSEDEYIAKAVKLAQDQEKLKEIRASLRGEMERGPLLDEQGFARKVEAAYRGMFEAWCAKEAQDAPQSNAAPAATPNAALQLQAQDFYDAANMLHDQGDMAKAEAGYRHALALNPNLADAHSNLGLVLMQQGRLNESEACYRRAVELTPNNEIAHYNLATNYKAQGRIPRALAAFRQALALKNDFAVAYVNLGLTLAEFGQHVEAETVWRQSLSALPEYADAYQGLGKALQQQGRLAEAEVCYRKAAELTPDDPPAQQQLAVKLAELGKPEEAEVLFRNVLERQSDSVAAWNGLADALNRQGRLEEAEAVTREALKIDPKSVAAQSTLAYTLQRQGRLLEAIAGFRRLVELQPEDKGNHGNLLFTLNYHPDAPAEEIYEAYREYDKRFGQPLRAQWQAHTNSKTPGRRLKVGYVSPDFRLHSCRHFMEPLLAHHDKDAIEVYAYAELAKEDALTARYKNYVEHWVPTRGMSDAALAERIRADDIDILMDLAGHTGGNRLGVFARKPAPVSLSWMGYGYTSGLSAIDYYLTDEACAPKGSEHLFAETPWRLPTPGYAYRPGPDMGEVGELPAVKNGHITFGTLTRAIRINHRTIRVWAEILNQVPNARLIIDSSSYKDEGTQEALAKQFAEHGVARERLQIGFHSPPWDVMRSMDIGLDCFPHNSGTTLFESVYMGVPYITLAGRPSVGRLGGSILHGVNHPEWIAQSEDEYIAKAVKLAQDQEKLKEIRTSLRGEMESGPLLDEQGFARKVEAAYRGMFEAWCAKEAQDGAAKPTAKPAATAKTKRKNSSPQQSVATPPQEPQEAQLRQLIALHGQGRFAEGEALAQRLVQAFPAHGLSWRMLGAMLQAQGKLNEALAAKQKAAELRPQDAEAHYNLASAYEKLNALEPAAQSYRQALALNPDDAEAWFCLGNVLQDLHQREQSETAFLAALHLRPDYFDAHNNLGQLLDRQNRQPEAQRCFEMALSLNPDSAMVLNNLASNQQKQGNLLRAIGLYREALQREPDSAHIRENLLFALNYHPDAPAEEIYEAYREYDQRFGMPLRAQWQAHANSKTPGRRLKVGYVSPDFRLHSCRHFMEPLLARHDKEAIEVYAYAELAKEDAYTARYKTYVEHWVPTRGMSDEALAERIRADGIDILMDLAGHTGGNRLGVFARKPTPVSLSWMGYGYTSGLSAIDYYLTDEACAPKGSEHLFAETPWRLPTPGYAYRPGPDMGEVGELPATKNGHITFGTLTRAIRINHRTIRVWAEILNQVPNARLIIDSSSYKDEGTQEALAKQFAEHGVERDRLQIGFHSPPWDVMRSMDIGLDCFPHNSGTTLFESVYMGVPYITLAGRPSVGRLGGSILHGVNHPEWIAQSEDEYIAKAVKLAQDQEKLKEIRTSLRGEMESGPLLDEQGFARKVEAAYRGMFEAWCVKEAQGAAHGGKT